MGSEVATKIGNALITAIEKAGIDPEMAKRGSARYPSTKLWIASQQLQSGTVGAGAALVPGVYLVGGVLVDIGFLAPKISIMTWGIGYRAGSLVEPRLDLGNVLGMWCGLLKEDHLVKAAEQVTRTAAPAVGTVLGARFLSRQLPKAAPKIWAKVGTKPAFKLAEKPFASHLSIKLLEATANRLAPGTSQGVSCCVGVPRHQGRREDHRSRGG